VTRRRAEPRIVDPATHPRRYVSLRVAAAYLEVNEKTLAKYLASGQIAFTQFGSRRKLRVDDLVAFEQRNRSDVFHVQRDSAE
jgi:excisionase family DNA binding protein